MKSLNAEVRKVVRQLKTAQRQFQSAVKNKNLVEEARKYAEKQGKEVRKVLLTDINKVKKFVEKERKELDRFQKMIPGEVQKELKKFRSYVESQRKEVEKLFDKVKKTAEEKTGVTLSTPKKKTHKKKAATKAQHTSSASAEASSDHGAENGTDQQASL